MTISQHTPKRGYTTGEAAHYIGRSVSWLRKKRMRGPDDPCDPGPKYLKTDRDVIYTKESLDAWIDHWAGGSGAPTSADVPDRAAKPRSRARRPECGP